MKLTNKAIKAFAYRGGWDVRWDDAIPGFGVRVYPSGAKSFIVRYRAGGRRKYMRLGRYGADLTLEQARGRARKALVNVRDGDDPLEERRKQAQGETFGDLLDAYIERHARVRKKTWAEDKRRLDKHIPARWRRSRADSITRPEIAKLHADIGANAPYEANRLLSLLHIIFRLGQVWGFIPEGATNSASGIDKLPEKKRARWAKPEEVAAIAKAIDAEPSIFVRGALWLYLLTGARKNELLKAKRAQVDWNRGQLALLDPKSGHEEHLTLSSPALAILQALPVEEQNPYLFPGAKKGHHIVNIDRAWRRVRKAAGVEDLRLHDLRRTAGSWMAQAGTDLQTIRQGLRHSSISTTLVYARLGEDAARETFEQYGRRIMEAAGKSRPVEVAGGDRNE